MLACLSFRVTYILNNEKEIQNKISLKVCRFISSALFHMECIVLTLSLILHVPEVYARFLSITASGCIVYQTSMAGYTDQYLYKNKFFSDCERQFKSLPYSPVGLISYKKKAKSRKLRQWYTNVPMILAGHQNTW